MGSWGCGADHLDAELVAEGAGFGVQIVEDFHVVGEEADGDDDRVGWIRAEVIVDVGL